MKSRLVSVITDLMGVVVGVQRSGSDQVLTLNSFCRSEYLEYVSEPLCVPFIESLGKTELDLLNPGLYKENTVLQKVQECLVGMARRGQQWGKLLPTNL